MWFQKRFDFYRLLLEQARMSEEGMKLLCDFVRTPTESIGDQVKQAEKAADELRRHLIEAINRTLVTPFDREDIFALSRSLDDMIDYANSTVEEMMLFQAPTNPHLVQMSEALFEGAREITAAVESLRHMPDGLQDHIIRAKKSENRMEHLYREALAELFKTPDVVTIIKMREIYRHLSNAADRGDEAADILSDILVKNT
jgi:predicted phosphate transport protein (TIGR00153 family)